MSRILKAAKDRDHNLSQLCRNWELGKTKDEKDTNDPVTSILYFRWIYWSFLGLLVLSGAALGLVLGIVFVPIRFWGPITLALFGALFWWHFYDRLFWLRQSRSFTFEVQNALDFMEAIEIAEKFHSLHQGSDFVQWNISHPTFLDPPIVSGLKLLAWDKAETSRCPWLKKEAEAKMDEWRRTHSLMVRLFPGLPTDYSEYFPKTTPEAAAQ